MGLMSARAVYPRDWGLGVGSPAGGTERGAASLHACCLPSAGLLPWEEGAARYRFFQDSSAAGTAAGLGGLPPPWTWWWGA